MVTGLIPKEDTCGHLWAVKALSLGQGRHKFRDQRPLIQVHGNQTGPDVVIVGKAADIKCNPILDHGLGLGMVPASVNGAGVGSHCSGVRLTTAEGGVWGASEANFGVSSPNGWGSLS